MSFEILFPFGLWVSEEEERDLHHQDMYMNGGRNHHFGPPPTQEG